MVEFNQDPAQIIITPEPTKPWYMSKTVWLNVVAVLVFICQSYNGPLPELDPATQGIILAILNGALRFLTYKGIVSK